MNDSNDQRILSPHAEEVAFFGALTASVTHELSNVLAIIEQINGLLEDLNANPASPQPQDRPKLASINERINRQVERGVQIVKRLNTFAHSAEIPVTTFEVVATLDNLAALSQRFAALKKIQLRFIEPGTVVLLKNNPFLLQQAVFSSLQMAWSEAREQEVIEIHLQEKEAGVQISVRWANSGRGSKAAVEALRRMVTRLHGACSWPVEEQRGIIELFIPNVIEES